MQSLAEIFRAAGCESVKTYIQSGNVVFKARLNAEDRFIARIGSAIEEKHGFRPAIHLLSREALQAAIAANPYREAEREPKSLHVFFLQSLPTDSQIESAIKCAKDSESFSIAGRCAYLHAPEGIARSKLASQLDKVLQTTSTARNWRTTIKLAELVESLE